MGKTVLVTGGAGYIGSHVCKQLAGRGDHPVVLDNLVTGHEWAVRWGPLEVGDIADTGRVREVIARHRPDIVMHFAAFAYVGESVTHPEKYYRNNVGGSLGLLTAMAEEGLKNIIFSSTCATYGVPRKVPIDESHPQEPINPYGASKLMVERILADFDRAHGFRHVALRYFNAAGADADGEIGELHNPETHLVPLIMEAVTGKREQVEIYGTDYDTTDGTAVRDYIHVTDLADAHVRAMDHLLEGGNSMALNLGTGDGYTVRQVIDAVAAVAGMPVPVLEGARREGDPPALVADYGEAEKRLGWRPACSTIDHIVATALAWTRELEEKGAPEVNMPGKAVPKGG